MFSKYSSYLELYFHQIAEHTTSNYKYVIRTELQSTIVSYSIK